ncbi:hypothetical protein SAMN04487894_102375 [Niabella drilacis]|uniref:Uncharacterized protein n=2 Tax=Niabella drilacis (strain DSM 25811 / CCM 8410 / CCUG 62505 / LMG 26954 / E90) TaxID=1285928 RepID=A0A1G6LJS0_NIADE|nr:hypothetical protein SAMN04487894_102375 [Niabella drilacis]
MGLKECFDQKGFTNSSPSIDGQQLRFPGFQQPLQCADFFFPAMIVSFMRASNYPP